MESGWRGNNIGGGVGNEDSADMVHQTLFQKKGVTSSDQRKGTLGGVGAEVVSCPTRLSSTHIFQHPENRGIKHGCARVEEPG